MTSTSPTGIQAKSYQYTWYWEEKEITRIEQSQERDVRVSSPFHCFVLLRERLLEVLLANSKRDLLCLVLSLLHSLS
jgi:hypothetical protein